MVDSASGGRGYLVFLSDLPDPRNLRSFGGLFD